MEDNIVSFPGRRQRRLLSPEVLQEWKTGLESRNYEQQWQTFEQMDYFSDLYVLQLIQEFLLSPSGEPLLKTKLLQKIKRECPLVDQLQVEKDGLQASVPLAQVPHKREDWPSYFLSIYHLIQEKAEKDPTLVEMAQELWIYVLEKNYPFLPNLEAVDDREARLFVDEGLPLEELELSTAQALKWTAALHFYTLKIINADFAERQLQEELPTSYLLLTEDIMSYTRRLEKHLFQGQYPK